MNNQPKTPGAMVLVERELLMSLSGLFPDGADNDGSGRLGFLPHVGKAVRQLKDVLATATDHIEDSRAPAEHPPAVGGEPDCRVDFENVMVAQGYAASRFEIESDRVEVDGLHGYKWHGQSYYLWCSARRPLLAEIQNLLAAGERVDREHAATVAQLESRIAELEAAQGEPVAVINEGDEGLFAEFIYGEDGSPLKRGDNLYRQALPVAAKVVLPERRELSRSTPYLSDLDHEWNACLDEIDRLNP